MIENPTYKSYLSALFHGEKSNSQPMEGQGSAKPPKGKGKKPESSAEDDRNLGFQP
jgi:hypothetical protein